MPPSDQDQVNAPPPLAKNLSEQAATGAWVISTTTPTYVANNLALHELQARRLPAECLFLLGISRLTRRTRNGGHLRQPARDPT